jgi:hypothetical protein
MASIDPFGDAVLVLGELWEHPTATARPATGPAFSLGATGRPAKPVSVSASIASAYAFGFSPQTIARIGVQP